MTQHADDLLARVSAPPEGEVFNKHAAQILAAVLVDEAGAAVFWS
jgi:hypothetical protein